jgi:hypothetical protein
MKKILFVLVIFFVCSCGVGSSLKKMLEIGSKIAAELGANNCQIGYSTNSSTDHGTNTQVSITLDGLGEKQQKQPRVKIASLAVMIYYQSLDPKEEAKYEDTQVEINVGKDHYERVFTKSEIERAFRLFKPINSFFDMRKSNDFSAWQQLIDTTFIPDSGMVNIKNVMSQIDSAAGKLNKIIITGFAASNLKDNQEPVTMIWVEAINGDEFSLYNFYFLNENEKIIHIGINQAPEEF